ncbi:HlyD family efflux transporter periplasmic adaptor subunit [Janthinobacterium aquaticum]|uniref:HlyD family efflux transporter periplasmic adaptor subunit n=1 Tax=Janthinobacterium sp. FT58W TaxID=2654254 RepID=UPI00126406D8|nr:HlyD family efflux transporter periplasmic adaptor subunit [Janthinobacterium sp. FT58W]KAB8041691.1 HlyD family efflux transporter periplasmic adaptor subunit [Janthinobacterium sp. FT58W]
MSLAEHLTLAQAASTVTPEPAEERLAPLREDLALQPAPPGLDGAPHWHIYDAARNRFFRIGWLEFELLSRWRGTMRAGELCEAVANATALAPEPEDVLDVQRFLQANELLRADAAQLRAQLHKVAASRQPSALTWLLHHYLFFRVPLVRPNAFLDRTSRWVLLLFRPAFFATCALLSLLGVWRVLDQWPAFTSTFLYFFSWQGALYYGLALGAAKMLHELAHAYTCKYYGVRVPAMGVALMMMWPLLYTDTSEAWKLTSRRARLAIGGAGVVAELILAGIAALLWSVAPDGGFKSAMYILAAVTWVSTLAINLNPFMRFDGYYLLMDLLDIPNLSERSFAIARWRLRKTVLGVQSAFPDPQLASRTHGLTLYAYATWLYRLIMFTGIAAAVYFFFFKVMGVILFAVEISWFVLRPMCNELRAWWQLRSRWSGNAARSALVLSGLVLLLAVPWRSDVVADGYWQAGKHSQLFPPMPARVEQVLVREGQQVRSGQPLFVLTAPAVSSQLVQLQSRIDGLVLRLNGAIDSPELYERSRVLEQELAAARAEYAAQSAEAGRLTVIAPHDGVVRDLDPGLYPGAWVSRSHVLGRVVDSSAALAQVYVHESDIGRVRPGALARLIERRHDGKAMEATVIGIDSTASRALPESMLSSVHGGPIAARAGRQGESLANEALYRVTLRLDQGGTGSMAPVVAHIEGERSSMLWSAGRKAAGVLVRESGL